MRRKVVQLPKDSRNVVIKKLAPSRYRISISDPESKKYLLKDSRSFHEGEVDLNGNWGIIGQAQPHQEELYIKGPLIRDLKLHVRKSLI